MEAQRNETTYSVTQLVGGGIEIQIQVTLVSPDLGDPRDEGGE